MSELISRLKEIIEKYNAGCYNETCNPFESCTDCVLKQIREVIESQPPADSGPDTNVGTNQWIPCSERLPEESGPYIVSVEYYGIPKVWRLYFTTVEYPRWLTFHKVTAWIPLPEPYKGE